MSPYPYSIKWLDCFAEPELVVPVYRQVLPLVDTTVIPDDEILTNQRGVAAGTGAKVYLTRDMLKLVKAQAYLLEQ